MILAIPFAWFGYKKAISNGRNGFLWAIITSVTFLITQLIVSLLSGILVGIILRMQGGTVGDSSVYNLPVAILAIIVSVIAGMLVLRHIDRVPKEEMYIPPPLEF